MRRFFHDKFSSRLWQCANVQRRKRYDDDVNDDDVVPTDVRWRQYDDDVNDDDDDGAKVLTLMGKMGVSFGSSLFLLQNINFMYIISSQTKVIIEAYKQETIINHGRI